MTYKQSLADAMSAIAADPAHLFVGYGLTHGRAMGTIPAGANILETPVAEGLMASLSIGLALQGRLPVVYFERMDFILNALDAIVNHLDKAATLSRGEFSPGVIIRCTVGNAKKPLFTGAPHTQDLSFGLNYMVEMPVITLGPGDNIPAIYAAAQAQQRRGQSTIIVEYKDLM